MKQLWRNAGPYHILRSLLSKPKKAHFSDFTLKLLWTFYFVIKNRYNQGYNNIKEIMNCQLRFIVISAKGPRQSTWSDSSGFVGEKSRGTCPHVDPFEKTIHSSQRGHRCFKVSQTRCTRTRSYNTFFNVLL